MSIHKWVGRRLLIRPSELFHNHALYYSSELHGHADQGLQVTSICLLHSSCFYAEISQLLCMHYYLCNCKVRRIDVISGNTKLIIKPFPEEYMLIVLYIVSNFTTNQTEIKMKTCKCWDGWNQCKLSFMNDEFVSISLSWCTRYSMYVSWCDHY